MATESPGATSGEAKPSVVDTPPLEQTRTAAAEVAPAQQQDETIKPVEDTPATMPEEVTQKPEAEVELNDAEKEEEADNKGGDIAEPMPEEVKVKVEEKVEGKPEKQVAGGMLMLQLHHDGLSNVRQSKRNL